MKKVSDPLTSACCEGSRAPAPRTAAELAPPKRASLSGSSRSWRLCRWEVEGACYEFQILGCMRVSWAVPGRQTRTG